MRRLALLIDAENAQPAALDRVMQMAADYGEIVERRAYGDWVNPCLSGWDDAFGRHRVFRVPFYGNGLRRNAADFTLTIDAMDLLHSQRIGGFCVMSSDSHFGAIVARIRSAGLLALGFGETKAPEAYRKAFEHFFLTDQAPCGAPTDDAELVHVIGQAVDAAAKEDGWAHLSTVGGRLPADFRERWPKKPLTDLIRPLSPFHLERRPSGKGEDWQVRRKPARIVRPCLVA